MVNKDRHRPLVELVKAEEEVRTRRCGEREDKQEKMPDHLNPVVVIVAFCIALLVAYLLGHFFPPLGR